MFLYKQIVDVLGRQILDCNGHPAIEVEILCDDGTIGKASGKVQMNQNIDTKVEDTEEIIHLINTIYADALIGENILMQVHLDRILEKIWNTSNKDEMHRDAIRTISMAIARTAASCLGLPLFRYLGGLGAYHMPKMILSIYECTGNEKNQLGFNEISIVADNEKAMEKMLYIRHEAYQCIAARIKEELMYEYSLETILKNLQIWMEKERILSKQEIVFALQKRTDSETEECDTTITFYKIGLSDAEEKSVICSDFLMKNTISKSLKDADSNQNRNQYTILKTLCEGTEDTFLLDVGIACGVTYIDLGMPDRLESVIMVNQMIRILEHF